MSEETGPLAGLPPADRTLLVRPPLELAVLEVRFVAEAADVAADVALAARERLAALGLSYVRQERAQEGRLEIQMQPGAAPVSNVQQGARGWQLHTADGTGHITLLPGAVVLQTSRYERWSVTLKPVLEALVAVAEEYLTPSVVDRIGLRYIDRFVDLSARTPAAWRGRVHPELLAAACHPVFGSHVRAAQQQVELTLGQAQGALLRHGPFVDAAAADAVSYLVDIDVFDAESIRFHVTEVVRRAEVLNRTAASLFQATLTPEYLRTLQQADIPADDLIEEAAP